MGNTLNPAQLNRLDTERLKRYRQMLDFYQGQQWPGAARNEKRLTFNYARVIIDKLAAYLMSGVHFTVAAGDGSTEAASRAARARTLLDEVCRDNSLERLDLETEIDCAILGDACYKVSWDAASRCVRVTSPDVQGIYAWWPADDSSRLWRVACRYYLGVDEAAQTYGVKTRGKTTGIVEVWTDAGFELWADDTLIESKPNPYGFIPFIIYPNLREPKKFWGLSDLAQVIEPQCELNRALSQLSRILELSGNPIAVLENVEASSDIAVRPGAVWNLPEEAKAYLLDLLQGGGVGLHINYIDLLYRTLHDIAEAPRAAFGGTGRDLSGVALEMEMQPLLQKVWRKRLIRTPVYVQRSQLILKLLQRYRGEDLDGCRPGVVWSPVLPREVSALVASEQTLVQSGIHSRQTAMSQLGVADPEAEFGRWLAERQAILGMNRDNGVRPARVRERDGAALAGDTEG